MSESVCVVCNGLLNRHSLYDLRACRERLRDRQQQEQKKAQEALERTQLEGELAKKEDA